MRVARSSKEGSTGRMQEDLVARKVSAGTSTYQRKSEEDLLHQLAAEQVKSHAEGGVNPEGAIQPCKDIVRINDVVRNDNSRLTLGGCQPHPTPNQRNSDGYDDGQLWPR